ncbi:MAG: hypothetical protein EBW84_09325 [Betaproteobacteria bacterium]|nr:hypothetical protein [Betaproteobacteria bacterium]
MMVDRLYPQRTAGLRPASAQEIKATSVIAMDIEQASAKIRARGVVDDDEDYDLPIYAERIPVAMVLGEPEPCPRLKSGVQRPATLAGYVANRPLQDALTEAYLNSYAKPQYSDASLSIYSNKNNVNFRIKLYEVFPTSLSTILFNTGDTAENIVTADATFRFSYYDYERI